MTIYILTFKSTAAHDAERRAGLNRFLKAAKRSYGLKCIGIEEREAQVPARKSARAIEIPGKLSKPLQNITEIITTNGDGKFAE